MDKNQVGTKVATRLFAAEAAIDAAMIQSTQLLEALVSTRRDLNVAVPALDVAEARVAEALAGLAQARRAAVAAHGALANVERKYGIEHYAAGPIKPPSASANETVHEIRAAG